MRRACFGLWTWGGTSATPRPRCWASPVRCQITSCSASARPGVRAGGRREGGGGGLQSGWVCGTPLVLPRSPPLSHTHTPHACACRHLLGHARPPGSGAGAGCAHVCGADALRPGAARRGALGAREPSACLLLLLQRKGVLVEDGAHTHKHLHHHNPPSCSAAAGGASSPGSSSSGSSRGHVSCRRSARDARTSDRQQGGGHHCCGVHAAWRPAGRAAAAAAAARTGGVQRHRGRAVAAARVPQCAAGARPQHAWWRPGMAPSMCGRQRRAR